MPVVKFTTDPAGPGKSRRSYDAYRIITAIDSALDDESLSTKNLDALLHLRWRVEDGMRSSDPFTLELDDDEFNFVRAHWKFADSVRHFRHVLADMEHADYVLKTDQRRPGYLPVENVEQSRRIMDRDWD